MKKFLKIVLIILIILLVKLITTYTINQTIISNYKRNKYRTDLIKILKITNINEPCIVYYNEGNIFYQQGKYQKAMDNYEIALKKHPNKKKACDIRINYSIAEISNITSKNKDDILRILKDSRERLYQDHCADPEDNSGRSQEAEELEEVIKEMEEELQKNQGSGNGDGDSSKDEEAQGDEESTIEQELQEINRGANASRQSELEDYKNLGEYQYYSGKSW